MPPRFFDRWPPRRVAALSAAFVVSIPLVFVASRWAFSLPSDGLWWVADLALFGVVVVAPPVLAVAGLLVSSRLLVWSVASRNGWVAVSSALVAAFLAAQLYCTVTGLRSLEPTWVTGDVEGDDLAAVRRVARMVLVCPCRDLYGAQASILRNERYPTYIYEDGFIGETIDPRSGMTGRIYKTDLLDLLALATARRDLQSLESVP